MTPHLHHRCVLALLASMILALCIGLLAWGPVVPQPVPHAPRFTALSTLLGAFAMCVTGWWGVRRAPAPAWSMFFVTVVLTGLALAIHHWQHGVAVQVAVHLCTGWMWAALSAALLAERVRERWARVTLLAGFMLAAASAAHWLVGQLVDGQGDLRGQLLLQSLPLLLLAAGAVQLPGRWTGPRDWHVVLALHALALLVQALRGGVPQPLLWGAAAMWLAYRVGGVAPAMSLSHDDAGASSHASTSLTTSR